MSVGCAGCGGPQWSREGLEITNSASEKAKLKKSATLLKKILKGVK